MERSPTAIAVGDASPTVEDASVRVQQPGQSQAQGGSPVVAQTVQEEYFGFNNSFAD